MARPKKQAGPAPRDAKRPDPKERELYRKVSVRMFGDERFRRLTPPNPCGQSLFTFLLYGPFTIRIPGVVVGGEMAMAEKLKWPIEGFREAFAEVSREGLANADWEAGVVWLPNGIKHNEPESPNVVVGWRSWWQFVPESTLRLKIYQGLRDYLAEMGGAFAEAFDKAYPEGSREGTRQPTPNQEQEQEQEQVPGTEVLRAQVGGGVIPGPRFESEGLDLIGRAYEKQQGSLLASREVIEVRSWLARGITPERFVEAIEVIGKAMREAPPADRPLSFWRTVLAKLRDTPKGEPIEWRSRTFSGPKAKPETDYPTLKRPEKP